MPHIDKFGREWRFTPDHDTGRMLQLSAKTASIGYNANYAFLTGRWDEKYPESVDGIEPEPYLLKMVGEWVMGIRYGNEGYQYLSPGVDERIISMMIEMHRRNCDFREFAAIFELVDEGKS